MEHTYIVTAEDLSDYADKDGSASVIPELIWMLIKESVPVQELTTCRIPYGKSINQPGLDGLVKTLNGFGRFIPPSKSYWEIGTGKNPQQKATKDFEKRISETAPSDAKEATCVVVTPRTWNLPAQQKWRNAREKFGWKDIKILGNYSAITAAG
jgi:hypothetical protein